MNRIGPRIVPCGIPLITSVHSMASRINFYSQLVISTIRISDISNRIADIPIVDISNSN